ncbi:cyclopropane-fatty-acyl-phospholipid synthase [Marinobacterium nitratireducens]|uniref:Cyclopropane-fatty-acyl-phospholipid synthase n=1 Tax=Marinobacterium nitratireducens TaxID=518897 RepID=A0A917ZAN5_9GAMM|nr:cyclopropane-fatty-acyl-phospholipid synthase family protein [Marinobacterium nitratireducens]GGO79746.1 cyclopropane-fatty-acyl-phospholipid synthase [Marinobacterium nitratireducens]
MKTTDLATDLSIQTDRSASGWLNRLCLRSLDPLLREIRHGQLRLWLPSGQALQAGQGQGPHAEVRLNNWRPIRRFLAGGELGWAESYLDGDWDTPDLLALMQWALANEDSLRPAAAGSVVSRMLHRLFHRSRRNSRRGSRRNIAFHYDLGNDFYRRWLDPTMTYSSALFAHPQQTLEAAQLNKYRRICELLELHPGQRVLEIGCGWGGFAETAAGEYGVTVDGITLSREQLAWARERVADSPLAARCRFSLTDYRDLDQRYDRIASIEMFEAVGEEHWPRYFDQLKRCLKPGGLAVLQVISIASDRFEDYRRGTDFIQRYVFPGGMLPSPDRLAAQIESAGLQLSHAEHFGADYARTLQHWRRAFDDSWPEIQPLGFDDRFRRLWHYYLAYCECGFNRGCIDVGLYLLRAP